MKRARRRILVPCLLACMAACSSGGGGGDPGATPDLAADLPGDVPADAVADAPDAAAPDPGAADLPPADLPPADGAADVAPDVPLPPLDLSRRLLPGEVAAGRVAKAADLLSGPAAKGAIGDWKIANAKVAFVVQDVGIHSFYMRYGGMPVDADVVRADGEPGGSTLGDLFFGWNLRLFVPQSVEVVDDGRNGGRAVLRVRGHDGDFPWLRSFVGLVPTEDLGLDLDYEYSLGPDDEFLTVSVTATNVLDTPFEATMIATAFIMGDGLQSHFPGAGFDASEHQGEFPGWAGFGDRVAYGLLADEGPITMIMNYSNIAFGSYAGFTIPGHGTRVLKRYLAVTAKGVDDVWRILRGVRPDGDTGRVEGAVTADAPGLADGIRVHVLDADGRHQSVIRADAEGRFQAELPVGSYRLVAKADGHDPSAPVAVEVAKDGTASAALDLPPATRFSFRVTDGTGPLPAKVSFFRTDAPAANLLPDPYGEEGHGMGSALTVYSATGSGEGVIPHGTYDVWATRGFEYERASLTVTAGEADLDLPFVLAPVVDTEGWLSMDGHVHGMYSPDSDVPQDLRVRTAMAEGQDVLIMTEHDAVKDFSGPVDATPGAAAWIRALAASEVTTYVYGHFNAFPLTEKPDLPNGGGIEWFDIPASVLFPRIRASEEHDVVIQVNHPRGAAMGAFFSAVALDTAAGTYDGLGPWSDDFDAIEVCNGGCGNGDRDALRDWFDFLSRGYRVCGSSGSDTHRPWGIGSPRNFFPTPHGPADLDPAELATAYHRQQVVVSTGPFVRFSVGGRGLGETLTEAGPLTADVEVQAPSWLSFQDLRILRNGEPVFTLPAADWGSAEGAVRFRDAVDLPASPADAWYVLEVRGTGSNWPVKGDTPYAVTNPVYVDVDGNGAFDAPLPRYVPSGG